MTWKAFAQDDMSWGGATLRMARISNGTVSEVINITTEDRDEGLTSTSTPPLQGPDAVAFMQAVMDAAYEYGLRPSRAQDERYLLAHLTDMRDIAKHVLKMDK